MRIMVRTGKPPCEELSVAQSLKKKVTGSNVGNMLYQQAVVKALSLPENDLSFISGNLHADQADQINAECNALVIPLANAFRPAFAERLQNTAALVEKLKVPVTIVGIGCQTDLEYGYANLDAISGAAKRLVSAVLDRSASIGVRGECTAGYLNKLGFKDVDIIGCPSMFMDGPNFKTPKTISDFTNRTKLSVNVSAVGSQAKFSTGLDKMGQLVAAAVRDYDDVEYVPQEDRSLRDLLVAKRPRDSEHSSVPTEAYDTLYRAGRVVAFVDPRTWFDHLSTRDFVFGTRLHGGIAGLLGGTAAHLIAHDSRTLELARYLEIPHTRIDQVGGTENAADFYERSDYAGLIAGHRARFDAYAAFLAKNGLREVFTAGDGGAAFDRQLAAANLAPLVRSPKSLSEVLDRKFDAFKEKVLKKAA